MLDIVSAELDLLGDEGITERELAMAKGNLRAETLLACEDSGARMSRIGAGLLLHGEMLTVDEVLARVAALTLDEVHAAAAELVAAPRTLSVVGPFDESDFDPARSGWAEHRPGPPSRRGAGQHPRVVRGHRTRRRCVRGRRTRRR